MTLSEMRDDMLARARVDMDLYEGFTLDENGNTVSEVAALTRQLNRAKTWWCKHTYACYDPRIVWTLTADEDEYSWSNSAVFSRWIYKPRFVIVNNATLTKPDRQTHGLWTLHELKRDRFAWWTYASGDPTACVLMPNQKFILSAPPSGAFTGKNFVDGWYIAADLAQTADDSSFDVPEEDHYPIVTMALALASDSMVTENEAAARLGRMDGFWREHADRRRRENVNAFIGASAGVRGSGCDWL